MNGCNRDYNAYEPLIFTSCHFTETGCHSQQSSGLHHPYPTLTTEKTDTGIIYVLVKKKLRKVHHSNVKRNKKSVTNKLNQNLQLAQKEQINP